MLLTIIFFVPVVPLLAQDQNTSVKAAPGTNAAITVRIEKSGDIDFMASQWKWSKPDTWEELIRTRIDEAFTALGAGKSLPSVEVTAECNRIAMVSLSIEGQSGSVKSENGKFHMQCAEVPLKGNLKARTPPDAAMELPFQATSVMFSPSMEFIPALFDAAALNLVSKLKPAYVDQNIYLNWIWERRQNLPQSVIHRHVEMNPQAKEGEPKEVVFKVREPGPTLWDAMLRISTQAAVDRVLKALAAAYSDTQNAIALTIQKASNRDDVRALLHQNGRSS